MLSVSRGSAQKIAHPATPEELTLTLDDSKITHDFNDYPISPKIISGRLVSGFRGFDILTVKINMNTPKHWIALTKIDGNIMNDGETFTVRPMEIHPIEIILTANRDKPDTESLCLTFSDGPNKLTWQCISLVITGNQSAVSTDHPASNITISPNPAGNYIFARGLGEERAGYKYEIFSLTGAEVLHGMLPSDACINVQDLNSGAYRLLLSDGKRTLTNMAFTVLH